MPENDIFYFHPDHLGSTSYITTRNGSISQHVEYIAFGEVLFEEHSSSFSSPYLFNGKELDRETNLSYYGARYLDMTTSLWLSVDPLAEKYPNIGGYTYCINNPLNAVDPDGNRVLFINGHWNRIASFFNLSPGTFGEKYWKFFHERIIKSIRNFLNVKEYETNVFIDGSSNFGGDQSGKDRYTNGYQYAKENYNALIKGLEEGETFKIAGHSEGTAFGAGIAAYLIEKGQKVEKILSLSPDEADEYSSPKGPITYQVHYKEDKISPDMKVEYTDYYLSLDGKGLT